MGASRREAGSARSVLVGSGLLALGAAAGILVGALFDAPRILLHRLQGPVYSADLQTGEIVSDANDGKTDPMADVSLGSDLEEFAALQEEPRPAAPPKPAPAKIPPKPATARPAAAGGAAAAERPPSLGKTVAAREPRVPVEPSAEALIRKIAERTKSPSPPPPEPASQPPATPKRKTRPKPEPTPSPPANDPPPRAGPVVQVGAFGNPADAETAVNKLREQGFDSYMSKKRAQGRYQHRVRVRPNGSNAKALADELKRHGYDVWITRE